MNKFSFLEQSIARACEGRDRSMKWIMGGCQGLTSSSFEDRYCVAYLFYFFVFFVSQAFEGKTSFNYCLKLIIA